MKLVIVGNVATGKTSFCNRWANGTFTDVYKATIGVDFVIKGDYQLWDVAGQERFGAVTSAFYRGAHGAFVVLDWNQPDAIEQAQKWINDLQSKHSKDIPILLVANKSDLPGRVAMEDLDALCKGNEAIIGWMATSAKTGIGVDEAVQRISSCVKVQKERDTHLIKLDYDDDLGEQIDKNCC